MIYVQILAILLLAFGYMVWPTTFSSAPAYNRPWPQVALFTAVVSVIVFGLGRLLPQVNKGTTVLLVLGALIVPGIVIGLGVVVWGEKAADRWAVRGALREAMNREHVKSLALFLEQPAGPQRALEVQPKDLARLEHYIDTLPPEVLNHHHVVEHLLRGIEIRVASRASQLPDASVEALCRLYVKLRTRLGFTPEGRPLDLRQRARIASRVAELGLVEWRWELNREHKAFLELSPYFESGHFKALFPQPLAPEQHVYSRTLGSLPLWMLMQRDALAPPPPDAEPEGEPSDAEARWYQEVREDLALMRSRGIDFTEDELHDERLRAFLQRAGAL